MNDIIFLFGIWFQILFQFFRRVFLDISPIAYIGSLVFTMFCFKCSHEHILMHTHPICLVVPVDGFILAFCVGYQMNTGSLVWYGCIEIMRFCASIWMNVSIIMNCTIIVSCESFDFIKFCNLADTYKLTFIVKAEEFHAVFPNSFIHEYGASGYLLFEVGDGYIETGCVVTFFCLVFRRFAVGNTVRAACQHCC